jgi:hypothetical protein
VSSENQLETVGEKGGGTGEEAEDAFMRRGWRDEDIKRR